MAVRTSVGPPEFLDRFARAAADGLAAGRLPGSGLLAQMCNYHLDGAGKLLRPALCLWACAAAGGEPGDALSAATSIELLHDFTLIHDDVQDGDRERRHRPTVWAVWSVEQAINAGDGLFAWAMVRLLEPGPGVERRAVAAYLLAAAVKDVVEGQCLDLAYERHPETPPGDYLRMVRLKTGALLGAALESGAVIAGAGAGLRGALRRAGVAAGAAFQVQDDWLGIWGDPSLTGKPAADLRSRKLSYPVAAAYAAAAEPDRERLRELYGERGPEGVEEIRSLLQRLGAGEATRREGRRLGQEAVTELDASGLDRHSLAEFAQLVEYFVERTA